jgi:hypothetical protein
MAAREGRRTQAREQLRTARGMLTEIGMTAFAERAQAELTAAGEEPPGQAGRRLPKLVAKLTGTGRRG